MIAAALLFVLQTDALPKVGEVRVLERTCRWVNKAEEIDFAQIEQYKVTVTGASPTAITVSIQRQITASLLEGQRIPADPVDKPDTWTQKFRPEAPVVLAWPGSRDKVEALLDQTTLLRLPAEGSFSVPNVTQHEIGALAGEAKAALRFSSPSFEAKGTWSGEKPWVNTKLSAKGQYLPSSSYRGDLTIETKWLPAPSG